MRSVAVCDERLRPMLPVVKKFRSPGRTIRARDLHQRGRNCPCSALFATRGQDMSFGSR